MKTTIDYQNGVLVASLEGELDHHGATAVRHAIDEATLRHHPKNLVLDMQGIGFMDSSGIGLIMGRYRRMQAAGGSLTVRGTSPQIDNMIRLAGLDALPIHGENGKEEHNETL